MPVRSFFDPISGRRETMEVKPIDREQKFRTVRNQVFPGTLLRIVLATSVVRRGI